MEGVKKTSRARNKKEFLKLAIVVLMMNWLRRPVAEGGVGMGA